MTVLTLAQNVSACLLRSPLVALIVALGAVGSDTVTAFDGEVAGGRSIAKTKLEWERLPDLPDSLGVAGPFVGVHNDALIVAGGANFPTPVWERDKQWHDRIHVLIRTNDGYAWRDGGRLPHRLAYGAAVSTPFGVVCMGGNDGAATFRDVFTLKWEPTSERIVREEWPALPKPCAFGQAVVVDDTIYLAGGQQDSELDSAMRNFWSLDLSTSDRPSEHEWKTLSPWTGPPRALNLTVAQSNGEDECIYVMSGRSQVGEETRFLTDVWEFTPRTALWRKRADLPRCVMAGTGIGVGDRSLLVLGGDDGTYFFKADELRDKHPGFPPETFEFDTVTNTWRPAGPSPQNQVTTIPVLWNDRIIIASGEVRPRVRTPQVWSVRALTMPQQPKTTDVCVYGGTSGGVVAAVQAARMGKRAVLVEPGRHLGGMTSGGLSAVDIGDPRSIGGIAREYFSRLVAGYGKQLSWDQPFKRQGGPATGGAYSIEPHVAERVFNEMVKEAGVVVLRDAHLMSITKDGARLTSLTTDDGRTIRSKMFIDATYEGDLMAAAGVTYTLMREGNAKYGESYNGIHYAEKYRPRTNHKSPGANGRVPGGQGVWDRDFPIDPFVVEGDPSSGLLPLIDEGEPGNPGEPAPGVMAYCYRLCLSTAEDRLPIAPPDGYNPARYEVVARFIDSCLENGDQMDLRWFSKHDPLPNDKWDFNTATFGGNLPGASWEWPEADHARRAQIAKTIADYHRGLLHFLATDSRVPETVRVDMQRFGLPPDEFVDNGGWPHQLYIREGRRMVSDLVMTEHHTFGREVAPHAVSLGSYGTDVHEIRRIVKDGVVTREGKVAAGRGGAGPYPIGYAAIIPGQNECENLFVTFALSASHTAFASIRMEPVFMATSQSAATAACLAIDDGVAVQEVDYDKLRERLDADGQVLEWNISKAGQRSVKLSGIVLDDSSAEYVGTWEISSAKPSLVGTSYRHDANSDQGRKSATFTVKIPEDGDYEVRLLYTADRNRSHRTKVIVQADRDESTFWLDQTLPVLLDQSPRAVGTFRFVTGKPGRVTISNEEADGYVSIDGLQLVPVEAVRKQRERN